MAKVTWFLTILTVTTTPALAQDVNPPPELVQPPRAEYSPFAEDYFPTRVLWGDTHVHTNYSTDAGMIGTTLGPDEAYRFARGEAVTSNLGWNVKLHRPLDFIVIADHAENLGLADFIRRSDPILLANEQGKAWHDLVKSGQGYEAFLDWLNRGMATGTDLINDDNMAPVVWDRVIENADRYNQPGTFTAFIGFEWSSARETEISIGTSYFGIVGSVRARFCPTRYSIPMTPRICGHT